MTCSYTSPGTCSPGPLGPSLAEMCNASAYVVYLSLLQELFRGNDRISEICKRVKSIEEPDEEYDFVVIGGGGGGAGAAGRLSEILDKKTLLIESGPDEPIGAKIPIFADTLVGTTVDWNYTTTNESYACRSTNGSCELSSGKMLGGGTSHNGMIYIRGNPTDYNNWAAEGNEGWSWEDVKYFYLKAEDNGEIERVGRFYHATGGPLPVERFRFTPSISKAILAASDEVGFGTSEDLNGEKLTGFTIAQATTKHGIRRSSASAYLQPARNRYNLHVSLESHAVRVIIANDTAVGVQFYKKGMLKTVRVRHEVVISAGTIGSPQILLLSGIGPKEHLETVGVEVVKDLPGVGENLHDHAAMQLTFSLDEPDRFDNNYAVAAQYNIDQTGPLSGYGLGPAMAALASNSTSPDDPDIQIYFNGYLEACAPGEKTALRSASRRTVFVRAVNLHTKSRGRVSLASKDPFEYPRIWVNYLSHSDDAEILIRAIQLTMKFSKAKALQAHNFTLVSPPLEACSRYTFLTDEYWNCAIRQGEVPELHLGGSCKMGPASDPMAVVDPRLRVHGIKGLRVADSSIMPKVISGNTAAPTMMIGERVADFIKKDWGWAS